MERLDSKLSDGQVRPLFFAVLRYPSGPTLRGAVFWWPKEGGGARLRGEGGMTRIGPIVVALKCEKDF